MEREPRNAQVVIQDSSENPTIFIIDESGVICTAEPHEQINYGSALVEQPDNGRVDLGIVFGDKTIRTPVYIEMDALD